MDDDIKVQARDDGSSELASLSIGQVDEAKLLRKIDLRVIPAICVLYTLAFLDRVNIGNASIFGLKQDLHLQGNQYNTALVIFFVPYVLCEIPSNILLKRFKPNVWLSLCMFLFGLTTTLQGLVQNYSGLLAARFFLGAFEAGMFAGCFYLISMWYTRAEAQKRYTFFFSSTTFAGAFGGLLASAIGNMDGMRGYRGWRWVFILEGVLTCVVSIATVWIISDFPEDTKWMTSEEKEYLKLKLYKDVGKSNVDESHTIWDTLEVLKDYKIIVSGFMYMGYVVPAYSISYFAPSIIQALGYSSIETQLHSVPPYAAALALGMIVAVASDRLQHRFAWIVLGSLIAIAGFIILLVVHDDHHLQYGAIFMATMGLYASMPVTVCWVSMNLGGHRRRSIGTAWQIGFGNIGGIIATYSFLAKDAPKYISGYSICIAFISLALATSCIYFVGITLENKKRDREQDSASALSDEEKRAMGDLNPDYRYIR